MRRLWARFVAARAGVRVIIGTKDRDLTEGQRHGRARLTAHGVYK